MWIDSADIVAKILITLLHGVSLALGHPIVNTTLLCSGVNSSHIKAYVMTCAGPVSIVDWQATSTRTTVMAISPGSVDRCTAIHHISKINERYTCPRILDLWPLLWCGWK